MNLTLLIYVFVFVCQSCVHASSTDKANVKVIKCKDAQTVTKDDKSSLKEAGFTKCAEPFGILVAGKTKTTDKTVLAMAKVVAELLDQNRDGVVDDQNVYKWIKCKIWFSVNAKKVDDVSLDGRTKLFEVDKFWYGYDVSATQKNRVRAEEAHHAIMQIGYQKAYVNQFDMDSNSTVVKECKKATCDWWQHPQNKCLKKKANGGKCKENNCNCVEWFHQVNMILVGQKPAWIAKSGMPKTAKAMQALLAKKDKPLLKMLKNEKYQILKKPMKFNYPAVKKTTPTLKSCKSD